jgi:tetratricopeptide (TPR) repeat protein
MTSILNKALFPSIGILIIFFHSLYGQDSKEPPRPEGKFIETQTTLLAPEVLYSSNTESVESMNSWLAITAQLLEELAATKAPVNIIICQVILSKNGKTSIEIIPEEPIENSLDSEIRELLMAITPPRVKHGSLAVRFSTAPRGISSKRVAKLHQQVLPYLNVTMTDFREMLFPQKVQYLQQWAKEEALPILRDYANLAHPKSEGIQSLSSFIDKHTDSRTYPIDSFVKTNPIFWRAVFEMPANKPLAPTIELFCHVSNGSFDLAKRLLNITLPFSSIDQPSGFYLDQLATYLQIFQQDLAIQLAEIRALREGGKIAEAIRSTEKLLEANPSSAIALNEYISLNLLERTNNGEKDVSLKNILTPELENQFYSKDPFFIGSTVIRSARDAYEHVTRVEIDNLFQDAQNYRDNLVRLADNCLKIRTWSIAAHLYHRALYYTESNEEGKQDIIEHFLFALENLGIKDFKQNFPGDHNIAFENIRNKLENTFQKSDAYKGFEVMQRALEKKKIESN